MRVLLLALAFLLAAPLALATNYPERCTKRGTAGRDVILGTSNGTRICAFGGNDYVNGRGGDDFLGGGWGHDTLVGGEGKDVLRGRRGDDRLVAIDGRGGDELYGGPGFDHCHGDPGDSFSSSCNRVHVS